MSGTAYPINDSCYFSKISPESLRLRSYFHIIFNIIIPILEDTLTQCNWQFYWEIRQNSKSWGLINFFHIVVWPGTLAPRWLLRMPKKAYQIARSKSDNSMAGIMQKWWYWEFVRLVRRVEPSFLARPILYTAFLIAILGKILL